MIKKNEQYEVIIEGYASEGQGVARIDGQVVFVPFAILGEEVKIHIIKVTKNYAVGKVIEILKPSKQRIEPLCPYYKRCGGCNFQHIKEDNIPEIKEQILLSALQKIGGFKNINVKNIVNSKKNYNYRNKSAFPLAIDSEGKLRVCMYKNLSHDPVFIDKCLLAKEQITKTLGAFEEYANSLDEKIKSELKFIVIRFVSDQLLFTLVGNVQPKNLSLLYDNLCKVLGKDIKVGLFFCKKNIDNNVILEGEVKHICGIERIVTNILGIKTDISAQSFFQINESIMEDIYKMVVQEFENDDIVVDAYSGAGLMSALIASKVKKVVSIEIVKSACQDALKTAKENNISNLEVVCADTKEVLPKIAKKLKEFSLVIDPPRKGVDKSVLETILLSKPKKIVYVSCSPASLARDLKILCEGGYSISLVQPFDMFPETCHIETMVVLKKI